MASPSARLSSLQLELARAFAQRAPGFFLTGGAVLAGWTLGHRTTDDLDLFTDSDAAMAMGDAALRGAAAEVGATVTPTTTSPDFRRFLARRGDEMLKVDLVRDRAPQLLPKVTRDGIRMDDIAEIVANKICALVGRSEIRDVVDLMFLEEHGFRIEDHLEAAQRKDGGATAATIAWLLGSLPIPEVLPGGVDRARVRVFVGALERRMLALAAPT